MPEPDENQNRDRGLLSNPQVATAISIAGLFMAIASIIFGIYSYVQGNRTRELIFSINEARAVVVDTTKSSRLSVTFDGKGVQTDITAVQIALWNNGRESIKKANILKPLVIATGEGVPILEPTIIKVTRKDIAKITLDESAIRDGKLIVNWDILEQNDGAVIQIIYAGDPIVPIFANAVIEGQGDITRSTDQIVRLPYWLFVVNLLVFAFPAMITVSLDLWFVRSRRTLWRPWRLLIILIYFGFGFCWTLYIFQSRTPPAPPFGF